MKNFVHFLFYTTLLISTLMGRTRAIVTDPIAEKSDVHTLIVFDSEYNAVGITLKLASSKDSGKIERFFF